MTTTAERIRIARDRLGITQHELARRLEVRQPLVARWETEDVDHLTSTVRRLAGALGVRPEWLAFGRGKP